LAQTTVEFILHREFVKDGDYDVSIDGRVAKINVIRVQNVEAMQKVVMDDLVSEGTVEMSHDYHGVVNISKIRLILPFVIDISSRNSNEPPTLKKRCIPYLNRLREVVRYHTNKYWMAPVSEHDITYFRILEEIEDSGRKRRGFALIFDSLVFPIQINEEAQVMKHINDMLLKGHKPPMSINLLLDSFNYFATGQFNEAVIIANIGMEAFVDEFITDVLSQKYSNQTDLNKKMNEALSGRFHRLIRKNFFKDLSDAELRGKNDAIYIKFCSARETRRSVMHARVRQIEESESLQAINDVRSVIKYILDNQKDMINWLHTKY
jgi:hypothetical protein